MILLLVYAAYALLVFAVLVSAGTKAAAVHPSGQDLHPAAVPAIAILGGALWPVTVTAILVIYLIPSRNRSPL